MRPSFQASSRPLGALPATSPLPIVVVGDVRPGRQHLVVEVPPAELAREVLEALLLIDSREDLVRRQAAEVQIGAQMRRGVRREVVGQIHIPPRPVSKPAAEAVPAGGFPTGGQVGHRQVRCEIGELGKPPARRTGRRAQLSRSRQRIAFARRTPRPPVRREDAVVVAALRGQLAGRDDGDALECAKVEALLLAGEPESAHPISRIAADVLTDEDGTRPCTPGPAASLR